MILKQRLWLKAPSKLRYRRGMVLNITILVLVVAGIISPAHAIAGSLVINTGGANRQFTAHDLLTRPDSATLQVQGDIYHGAVKYRAVPLLSLLGAKPADKFDTLEMKSSDDFVGQLPLSLVAKGASGGAVAWIAVEDPAHPWPKLPGHTGSAGPFYLIWQHPERSGVTREQWPYMLVGLSLVESPAYRWPQLAVPADLPTGSPARRGEEVFQTQCLVCHQLNGGGAGVMGPDLGRPMNPTHYLTDSGLRGIIRDPHAVRTWPGQKMVGFDKTILPDADLDALIAYLHVMAGSNPPAASPR
jgi:mono/diheme cytochrome c family protein